MSYQILSQKKGQRNYIEKGNNIVYIFYLKNILKAEPLISLFLLNSFIHLKKI